MLKFSIKHDCNPPLYNVHAPPDSAPHEQESVEIEVVRGVRMYCKVGVSEKNKRGDETWRVKASCCQISAHGFRINMVRKSQTLQDPMTEKGQHPVGGGDQSAALSPLFQFFSENLKINL